MNVPGSKHMTKEDRKLIRLLLDQNKSCKYIAEAVGFDDRTISKEIKKRRNKIENGKFYFASVSKDYQIPECKRLTRFPYVCNGCNNSRRCIQQFKYRYEEDVAQENYKIILSDSRVGLDCTIDEKAKFDSVIKDGLSKGQSIHHIIESHKGELRYSERSAYRLIDKELVNDVSYSDLRRKVRLKPRKKYAPKEDNKEIRTGRRYADFIKYKALNPNSYVTEIDTVESTNSGIHKCFLTIHFTWLHAMLIFILDRKTKYNVSNVFINLQKELGESLYKKMFQVILTDRGTEFCDPLSIENDYLTGKKLTSVFYCNSYASYEKGSIEENHELIRYIIPKGTIFDELTQIDANKIASHINCYYRKSIETTPYNLMELYFGPTFLDKIKVELIEPDQVTLTPKLLK